MVTFRRLDSDSPAILDMISGPLMRKKKAPVSLATALAISVLPEPGGPYSSTPLHHHRQWVSQEAGGWSCVAAARGMEGARDGWRVVSYRGGLTPRVLKRVGCRRGSSIISRICAIWRRHPPMSS